MAYLSERNRAALQLVCPSCNAKPGKCCVTRHNKEAINPHVSRIRAAGHDPYKAQRVPKPQQAYSQRPRHRTLETVTKVVGGITWVMLGSNYGLWGAHPLVPPGEPWPWFGHITDHTGKSWASSSPVSLHATYERRQPQGKERPVLSFRTLEEAMEHFPLYLLRMRLLGSMLVRADARLHELEARFGHLID